MVPVKDGKRYKGLQRKNFKNERVTNLQACETSREPRAGSQFFSYFFLSFT